MAIRNFKDIKNRRKKEKEEMEMVENSRVVESEMDEKVEIEETVKMEPEDNGIDAVGIEDPEQEVVQLVGNIEESVWPQENLTDADDTQDNKVVLETSSQITIIPKATPRAKSMPIEFRLAQSRGQTRKCFKASVVSIINSGKCRRIVFPEKLIADIGHPDQIQAGFTDDGILISKKLSADKKYDKYFQLRKLGRMCVLYSGPLVSEVTDEFCLDFRNGSLKFNDVEYLVVNHRKAAHIKLI